MITAFFTATAVVLGACFLAALKLLWIWFIINRTESVTRAVVYAMAPLIIFLIAGYTVEFYLDGSK